MLQSVFPALQWARVGTAATLAFAPDADGDGSTVAAEVTGTAYTESGPSFTFRGKTGLGAQDGRAIGWLVGYAERDGHRWLYATLVRGSADADVDAEMTRLMPVRRSITRALLTRIHVLPGP